MQMAALVAVLVAVTNSQNMNDGGPGDDAVLTLGRRLSADFWAGRIDAVWAQMSGRMQEALGGSPAGLASAREKILAMSGGSGQLLGEEVEHVQGMRVYLRTFQGPNAEKPLRERWVIQDDGTVAGFFLQPAGLHTVPAPSGQTRSDARLVLALSLLAGTSLAMYALSLWLRRSSNES